MHLFVAHVVKSLDIVDRSILDHVLSCLGLPVCFRHTNFEHHAKVRLRLKLACRSWGTLDQRWVYLPCCRCLHELPGVTSQLYAANLKCVTSNPAQLLRAARSTSAKKTIGRTGAHRVLSCPGLLGWLRHAYVECLARVRLRFTLAAALGEPWTRDGWHSPRVSTEHDVYLPLCRHLHQLPGIRTPPPPLPLPPLPVVRMQ